MGSGGKPFVLLRPGQSASVCDHAVSEGFVLRCVSEDRLTPQALRPCSRGRCSSGRRPSGTDLLCHQGRRVEDAPQHGVRAPAARWEPTSTASSSVLSAPATASTRSRPWDRWLVAVGCSWSQLLWAGRMPLRRWSWLVALGRSWSGLRCQRAFNRPTARSLVLVLDLVSVIVGAVQRLGAGADFGAEGRARSH